MRNNKRKNLPDFNYYYLTLALVAIFSSGFTFLIIGAFTEDREWALWVGGALIVISIYVTAWAQYVLYIARKNAKARKAAQVAQKYLHKNEQ